MTGTFRMESGKQTKSHGNERGNEITFAYEEGSAQAGRWSDMWDVHDTQKPGSGPPTTREHANAHFPHFRHVRPPRCELCVLYALFPWTGLTRGHPLPRYKQKSERLSSATGSASIVVFTSPLSPSPTRLMVTSRDWRLTKVPGIDHGRQDERDT